MASLILADWLANAAAIQIGDPLRGRVKTVDWLYAYNMTMHDICVLYDVLQYEATADLPLDGLASYPEESTRISEVAWNMNPADVSGWRVLKEKFEDEYRELTISGLPTTDSPEHYFADVGYIRIIARLTADIIGGLRVKFFGVPDEAFDLTTTNMPLPNFMRNYAIERMVVYGLRADSRDAQASDIENRWNQREGWIREKLGDRSVDRRDAIRPAGSRNKYGGMA